MLSEVFLFLIGCIFGHVLPRFPVLLMSRGRGFNTHFPPHPQPVPLGPHLNQRILHLRTFYWLSLVVAVLPLGLGLASVRWGNAAFGFGLWLSSGWLVLSRLQTFLGGLSPPWSRSMAIELQMIINESSGERACCSWPTPVWGVTEVRCTNCTSTLRKMARPDLGRKRTDGRVVGLLRLLISDGYPIITERHHLQLIAEEE
jgi:hypothetical protein|tara:strand:- start:333 stop:935 length:603 start_codon:yes stop_codon:yes gene_type:complete